MKNLFAKLPVLEGGRILLRPLNTEDAPGLKKLTESTRVYRYLPTFLFEKRYLDASEVIRHLYDEGLEESLILGVFENGTFCGLAEMYGYRPEIRKISVGYRLLESAWGRGIASEALRLMVAFLYGKTDIEIITASTMVENTASARVLVKNGFSLVVHASQEDWGYDRPTTADKWIR